MRALRIVAAAVAAAALSQTALAQDFSIFRSMAAETRRPTMGAWPVRGRPRFLRLFRMNFC